MFGLRCGRSHDPYDKWLLMPGRKWQLLFLLPGCRKLSILVAIDDSKYFEKKKSLG
jgi:hypothetical protein